MTRQVILTEKKWVGYISPTPGHFEYTNPQQATFHTFMQASEEVEEGVVHYSVALVETIDGYIHEVSVDRIRFINPI